MQKHTALALIVAVLPSAVLSAQDPFPEVGKPAPKFTAKDQAGNDVIVGGKSKNWTVLAFYPKALTGG